MNNLTNILNLEVQHEYYADEKSKNVQLTPNANTQQWIQQHGWRISQRENKWHFFAPASTNVAQLIQDNPDFKLTLEGSSSDPLFIPVTDDLPLDKLGILVFSNSPDSAAILSSEFEASPNENTSAIARIQLHLDQLQNSTNGGPIEYTISFKTRAVALKYFIVSGMEKNPYTLHLKGDQADFFSGPNEESLPDGRIAQVFDSSSNLFPLKEKGGLSLSLWGKHSIDTPPGEIALIHQLPQPNPASLQIVLVEDEQAIFAPIYVYI